MTQSIQHPWLETQIIRVRQSEPLPEGWRVTRILQSSRVANNDGGTGAHYEYDVEVERWVRPE